MGAAAKAAVVKAAMVKGAAVMGEAVKEEAAREEAVKAGCTERYGEAWSRHIIRDLVFLYASLHQGHRWLPVMKLTLLDPRLYHHNKYNRS